MRKSLIFFLFCCLFSFLQAKTVEYQELVERSGYTYYGDDLYTGKAVEGRNRTYFQDGKATGMWLFFYPNGNIKSIESWQDGNLQGKYILYLEDGTKSMQTFYEKGKDNGEYTLYYRDGRVRIRGYYQGGKPKGIWEYYDENGKLRGKGKGNL